MTSDNAADKQQVLDRVYELGYEYEQKYGGCSQCTLAAIQDVMGVGSDDLFKASYSLAAGHAATRQGTCGALSGATLAVGSRCGRDRANFHDPGTVDSHVPAKQVFDAFVEIFGSPICAEIQTKLMGRSFDFWCEKEWEAFLAAGGHDDKCTNVVGTAAKIAAELLLELEAREES